MLHLGNATVAMSTRPKPHVVFVLMDDWGSFDAGWRQTEAGRAPLLRTPRLDALARAGARLDNYYVQHICSPTRSALLSARYQIHTGLQTDIIQAWARVCLPPSFGTLADAMQMLGYRTHMVGKWHVGIYKEACLPWRRGFETYYGFLTGSERHYTKVQRVRRGDVSANTSALYPDFRTETGPISTHCVTPPLAPPPPPPPPCGAGSAGLPRCNYTIVGGYLPEGDDCAPPASMRSGRAAHDVKSTAARLINSTLKKLFTEVFRHKR